MAIQTISYLDKKRDWRELALCKDTSPELFFPVGNTGSALDAISLAKLGPDRIEIGFLGK